MASLRSLFAVGASSVIAGAGVLSLAEGCTTFGEETADSGPNASEAAPGDVGTDAPPNPPPIACDGGPPIVYRPAEAEAKPTTGNSGTVTATTTPSGIVSVHAEGRAPKGEGNGTRGYMSWSRSVPPLPSRDFSVELDLSARFDGPSLYAEVGCRVGVVGAASARSTAEVVLRGAELYLGGHETGGGKSFDTYRGFDPLARIEGGLLTPIHVRFDLSVRPGQLTHRVTVGGKTDTKTVVAPTPIANISIDCGIVYADNGNDTPLAIDASNVSLSVCP